MTSSPDYVRLGRTALRISRLCLGTMNFGPRTDRAESAAMLDAATERGINLIDTSNSYGQRAAVRGEEVIGEWLEASPGRRKDLVIATKMSSPQGQGPNDRGLSAKHIRHACEDSLRRLRTDYIDLYQIHHIDRDSCWEEIWQALDQLRQEGKILYTGSSNFPGWHIAQASEAARRWNLLGLVSEQSVYNLANRMLELEVIPACAAYGMALLAYSPLGGGVLAGILGKTVDAGMRSDSPHSRQLLDRRRAAIEHYEQLCLDLSRNPAEVALAWILSRDGVTAPVVGPRTMEHLETALGSLELRLDEAVLARLDEIFPGPGGPAPEAYAW